MAVVEWPPGEFWDQLRELNRQLERLRQCVDQVLAKIPGWLSEAAKPIVAAWDKIVELSKKIWKELEVFFAEPGDPGRLNDAGKVFNESVQGTVSAQAGKFTETYMKVDDKWKGDAAEAYKKVLKPDAPQTLALKQYAGTVLEVGKALNNCRWAIIGFWIACGAALATLIGAIVAACIGVVSIAGTIPALLYGAGCIGAFLVAVGVAAGIAIGVMSDAATTFRIQNNGNDNLPAGKWPPSGVVAY
ncbi:hypothetical protein [Streptosporangium sp. NPDC002524]|uniref:hypothetical protein n=1 Tax=Streptosporangium sp. NPDC002524 TaxID=3154537 RepID=UPI0033274520